MTECERYQELISSMADEELSKDERLALSAHMEHCSQCNAMYAVFSQLSEIIGQDTETLPEGLHENIMAGVRRTALINKNRRVRRTIPKPVRNILAAAACVAVVLLAARGISPADMSETSVIRGADAQAVQNDAYAAPASAAPAGLPESAPQPALETAALAAETAAPGMSGNTQNAGSGFSVNTPVSTPAATQTPHDEYSGAGPGAVYTQPPRSTAPPVRTAAPEPVQTQTPVVTAPPTATFGSGQVQSGAPAVVTSSQTPAVSDAGTPDSRPAAQTPAVSNAPAAAPAAPSDKSESGSDKDLAEDNTVFRGFRSFFSRAPMTATAPQSDETEANEALAAESAAVAEQAADSAVQSARSEELVPVSIEIDSEDIRCELLKLLFGADVQYSQGDVPVPTPVPTAKPAEEKPVATPAAGDKQQDKEELEKLPEGTADRIYEISFIRSGESDPHESIKICVYGEDIYCVIPLQDGGEKVVPAVCSVDELDAFMDGLQQEESTPESTPAPSAEHAA